MNLIGQNFNRLTVLSESGRNKNGRIVWLCQCNCGSKINVNSLSLRTKNTQSCGCLRKERTTKLKLSHGKTKTSEYVAWKGLIRRCTKPKNTHYSEYGGRGIKVCDRWLKSFENFLEDMKEKPSSFHSIDRIDNNGNYEPDNCRWATIKEQANNRQNSRYYNYDGEPQTLRQLFNKYSPPLSYRTFRARVENGWPMFQALTTPTIK